MNCSAFAASVEGLFFGFLQHWKESEDDVCQMCKQDDSMFSLKDNDLGGFVQVFEARCGSCCKKSLMYIHTPSGSTKPCRPEEIELFG